MHYAGNEKHVGSQLTSTSSVYCKVASVFDSTSLPRHFPAEPSSTHRWQLLPTVHFTHTGLLIRYAPYFTSMGIQQAFLYLLGKKAVLKVKLYKMSFFCSASH